MFIENFLLPLYLIDTKIWWVGGGGSDTTFHASMILQSSEFLGVLTVSVNTASLVTSHHNMEAGFIYIHGRDTVLVSSRLYIH